jgi:PTH1 family peptidyl-tRNA hydrolase
MIIIIGLGNPGEQYKSTRHNVGFMALDKFAEKNNFPEFKLQKKADALTSEKIIGNEAVILAKPQTFMNDSGKTARELLKNSQFSTGNIVIVHDDIDLPVGKIKIIQERGSAGHKGVESIINAVGNDGLVRFRIGISPQDDVEAMKIVLKSFSKNEKKLIDQAIEKTCQAIDLFIKEGLDKAMNEHNG